jgi:hypothetical protein
MNIKTMHLIYPLSLAFGITIAILPLIYKLENKANAYNLGILVMYISWLLVYFTFIKEKK